MRRGTFAIVRLGGIAIGRATYEPGWKWSIDVGPARGERLCSVEHVGLVHVPPVPHDSWVVGDGPYVSLHFLGADRYAKIA
ncbi:MAG: hypothetical protein E6K80_09050 [Candidatus Eisenbacteria bacterium]|uniref:Uncharacterized protein n=1 Tax=Eiseniibacteriota bacterium TaxID=2212470 RepID=A0A538U2X9_UNCEI|nr:MAG: hypothetical protein E6K80_09050 [Candidatus Eisenbacteria bacterium]